MANCMDSGLIARQQANSHSKQQQSSRAVQISCTLQRLFTFVLVSLFLRSTLLFQFFLCQIGILFCRRYNCGLCVFILFVQTLLYFFWPIIANIQIKRMIVVVCYGTQICRFSRLCFSKYLEKTLLMICVKNDFYFFGIQSKLVFFPRLQRMRANFFLFRISLSCMFLLKVLLIIFYGRETIYHLQ